MIEERSFENPAFARRAMREVICVLAAASCVFTINTFVTVEWDIWPRMLVHGAAFVLIWRVGAFLFWRSGGVPMGHWLTGR